MSTLILNKNITMNFLKDAAAVARSGKAFAEHLFKLLGATPSYDDATAVRSQFYELAAQSGKTPESARQYWSRCLRMAGITPATKTGKVRTNKKSSPVQRNPDLVKWMRETASAIASGEAPALLVAMLYDVKNESAE